MCSVLCKFILATYCKYEVVGENLSTECKNHYLYRVANICILLPTSASYNFWQLVYSNNPFYCLLAYKSIIFSIKFKRNNLNALVLGEKSQMLYLEPSSILMKVNLLFIVWLLATMLNHFQKLNKKQTLRTLENIRNIMIRICWKFYLSGLFGPFWLFDNPDF